MNLVLLSRCISRATRGPVSFPGILLGQDGCLLVFDLLVDLRAPRRLVAVHLRGQGRVDLGRLVFLAQPTLAGVVVLWARGREAVADAALVLCARSEALALALAVA